MKKIYGENAYRDSSGAIAFADHDSYNQARLRKKRQKEERERAVKMHSLEERINNLESKLDQILNKLQ